MLVKIVNWNDDTITREYFNNQSELNDWKIENADNYFNISDQSECNDVPTLDRTPCAKCTYPHIHSDQEAMQHLAEKLSEYTVLDINQCEEKVLLKDGQSNLKAFSYSLRISSRLTDNRFDYYIHGDITAHDRLIKELFKSQADAVA